MKNTISKVVLISLLILSIYLFFAYDINRYFTIDFLKSRQQAFDSYYSDHTAFTITVYMLIYIVMAALSLPGAAVMTLAGGALFGLLTGTIAVSFASSIGATLAFLVARFLLRDYVRKKFDKRLAPIDEGVKKEGAFYLFTLRLVPVFPFFLINLAMGLTAMRTLTFYLVSQAGMLAGTIVYVNAGTQLAKIETLKGIMSPGLIFSFALLGLFPLIAKRTTDFIKARKVYANHPRPDKFDYNLVVIGAGSAGLVTAYIAATVKAKVALVEKDKMGGDCLNTGCVPSKALIRSAKMVSYAKRAGEFGFRSADVDYDFSDVMDRVHHIVKRVEPHDSVERYTGLGVECIKGEARILSPFTVQVDGRALTTKNIVIATGARPFVPPIPGLDQVRYLTSDNVWELRKLPEKLVVLGGGPIGCELAQAFGRLGSRVTQVEMAPRIMGREDEEVSETVKTRFENEGIRVLTGHRAKEVVVEENSRCLVCDRDGTEVKVDFDEILVAVGRAPNTKGFGLEELGVELSERGTIRTNTLLQTNFPNIYCAGDVAGPYQFTHTAAHQAWYASVNALFGKFKSFKVDYRVIPWATYTEPEVARVGLNELDARASNIDYQVTRYEINDLDRAIADSEAHGFVKVLTRPGTDKILGVTIVGSHAGDIISEFVLAMKNDLGLNKILRTIHIYPTLAEANKYAAGEWKKANKPEKLLNFLGKFHAWSRG